MEGEDLYNKPNQVLESGVKEDASIEAFIQTIPNPNRAEAIANARLRREVFTARVWKRERSNLSEEIISGNNLTDDAEGWERYLQFVYSKESEFQRESYQFEEWSVKYIYEMLSKLEQDATNITHKEELNSPAEKDLLRVPRSSFEAHSRDRIFNGDIAKGIYKPIEPDSLLAHALSEKSLEKVIKSGVVGAGGLSYCTMSQDRVIYDEGYVILFQAKDLVGAGYSLLQINEDGRDAHILKEWRSNMPIDINLARLVVSTADISDRDRVANQSQIAQLYYGEEYLKQIPRI